MTRWRLLGGATVLVLCAQYLVAEAIAAAAWTRPYSYSHNYISDLGVTDCVGAGPCSPLGSVMNGGFVLSGILAILAAGLLAPLVKGAAARAIVVGCAVSHGLGSMIVGLVHSAPGTAAGTPHLHILGAYAAIVGGNLSLITAGLAASSTLATRAYRLGSTALGVFGLGCGLALVNTRGVPPGLLERGAVDTITVWEVVTGAALLIIVGRAGARGLPA